MVSPGKASVSSNKTKLQVVDDDQLRTSKQSLCPECFLPCQLLLNDYFKCKCCNSQVHFKCCHLNDIATNSALLCNANCLFICNQCSNSSIILVKDNNSLDMKVNNANHSTVSSSFDKVLSEIHSLHEQIANLNEKLVLLTRDAQNSTRQLKPLEITRSKLFQYPSPSVTYNGSQSINYNKFQVKIDGVHESPLNTARDIRVDDDFNSVSKILNFLNVNVQVGSTYRLGKYLPNANRSIIVNLNSSFDLKAVTGKAHLLKNYETKIYLNEVLYGDEAKLHRAALKERWRLISQDNVCRQSIKIKRNKLFVNGKLQNLSHLIAKDTNLESSHSVNHNEAVSTPASTVSVPSNSNSI